MSEWNIKVAAPMNRVWKHPGGYLEGCVITERGIVSVYSQGGSNEAASTDLQFVCGGRLYSRSINRRYSKRGLVTIANRFAQEVCDSQENTP